MNYLFLYTELADYTIACIRSLKMLDPNVNVTVVHFPVNPEAPFKFNFEGLGDFYPVTSFKSYDELKDLVIRIKPDKIVCSGWINRWYLRVCWSNRKNAVCILTMDNHWLGAPKQYLMKVIGKMFLKKVFKKVWVPGQAQFNYAIKLGFKPKQIALGFYACDTSKFLNLGRKWIPFKMESFPRRILCVARYIPVKGYAELWKAFIEWQEEDPNEWELWCVGAGDGFESRTLHSKIKHLGFLQSNEWDNVIQNTGVFILPSHFEPWGVVVHEFAAAGYPLILSDKVGAREFFLTADNGWEIQSGNVSSIKATFKKLRDESAERLLQKAAASRELAAKYSPDSWAKTLSLL